MTKEQLEQYVALKREIEQLESDLNKLFDKSTPVFAGKVKASSYEFPFIEHGINLKMGNPEYSSEIKELIKLKADRKAKCLDQIIKIEKFISGIPDSNLRQIFELRYIKGMKLREVAKIVHLDLSTVSVNITRYLEKCQTNQKNQCYNLN